MKKLHILLLFIISAGFLHSQQKQENESAVLTKILPYRTFVSDACFTIPLQIAGRNKEAVDIELRAASGPEKIHLKPGETVVTNIRFPATPPESIMKISVLLNDMACGEKQIAVTVPGNTDIKIDGPFLKDNAGNYVVITVPEYTFKGQPDFKKNRITITLAGSYPEKLKKLLGAELRKAGLTSEITAIEEPLYGRSHRLFSEYKHLAVKIAEPEKQDIIVIFPYTESLLKKTPPEEWADTVDAILCLAEKKFSAAIVASPFPSPPFPDAFAPYKKAIEPITKKRNVYFLDLYNLYLGNSEWKNFFMYSERIYRNIPDEKGTVILVKELVRLLLLSRN